MMNLLLRSLLVSAAVAWSPAWTAEVTLSSRHVQLRLDPDNGAYEIVDHAGGTTWRSHPYTPRFGEITLAPAGGQRTLPLGRCEAQVSRHTLRATFRPLPDTPEAALTVTVTALEDGRTLEFAYTAAPSLPVERVRLLDQALWVSDLEAGYLLVPVREGLLIPANSQLEFTRAFDTYAYEGCHMTMLGVVKRGAALLLTWSDPYVLAEVQSRLQSPLAGVGRQVLAPSLVLRKSARSFRVQCLGAGDHVTVAKAYRPVARERGWAVPWSEKPKRHPERARLFGAVNFKLWSMLERQMNEASTAEEYCRVNWTFDEAAQVAEHLKRDLQLERVLFLMGGWIRRGYDNQHPDILPSAPECGGDAAFTRSVQRIQQLGYLVGLHDNYQDMYRDAPSWNEDYLMRSADGAIAQGGKWAGGRAYLTCSKKALELAQRPQNLPAVHALTHADAYFIDTTYAAGLMECFAPTHPLTRAEDLRWKQAISDYARDRFGIFGSECGREWALPHSDFFEGLTGVSGRPYHDAGLLAATGGSVVPLFELVYRDGIAMYGKYGYDINRSADYVLQHLLFGRPLHHHDVPAHLYWKTSPEDPDTLAVHPREPELEWVGPREVRLSYLWQVDRTPKEDWQVFVHFTDPQGTNWFQNDHAPATPTSQWLPSLMESRHFTLVLPANLRGALDIRVGLWQPSTGRRAKLTGIDDGARRYFVGRLRLTDTEATILPPVPRGPGGGPDPGIYARAHNGWGAALHPYDRFIKNTYEMLSPLNELTAQRPLAQHRFLTPDRKVEQSVFGEGQDAVKVTANRGPRPYVHASEIGGEAELPPYGFVIESRTFVAFYASSWAGLRYDAPPLFTLRSLDGKPVARSRQLRVYHGFGDTSLRLGRAQVRVEREAAIDPDRPNPRPPRSPR